MGQVSRATVPTPGIPLELFRNGYLLLMEERASLRFAFTATYLMTYTQTAKTVL